MATRQSPIEPTMTTRRDWAGVWGMKVSALLDSPPARKHTAQRLWRMRLWDAEGDYLIVTLMQSLVPPAGVPSDQAVKVAIFLTRPYTRATLSGGSVVQMQLAGQYSVDEIVAFLRLDLVDPDGGAEWRDETKYSDLVVVSDIIAKHARN